MNTSLPKPPSPDQTPSASKPSEEKPKKEKKPATEAQLAARAKGLAAMTAKRKEISQDVKEKKEKIKQAKKVVEEKILKEDLAFATRTDVDSLRKELAEVRALYTVAKEQAAASHMEKPKERIVERIIEKQPVAVTTTQTKLTGHALLDKLFF